MLINPICNNQRVNYFNRIKNNYKTLNVPFAKKTFCIFTSRNLLNNNKQYVVREF